MTHDVRQLPPAAGIGWRQPHYAQVMAQLPSLGFLEVHSENFFARGGAARATLRQAREHYPISLHGVGLSLGSACGIDEDHLRRLSELVADIDPVRVSDHACFGRATLPERHDTIWHANDLLPVAFTEAALSILVSNISHVQARLRRPILVENLSFYLHWQDSDWSEPQFLAELARRSGCELLLDVNNLVVNALNAKVLDPVASVCAWLDALDTDAIGEFHLAGYAQQRSATGSSLVIDDHGSRVHEPVWRVFEHAVRRWGVRPTLIEWDTDVPALDVLLEEAQQAQTILTRHAMTPHLHAEEKMPDFRKVA
jgi:uncharacterized protein (UPF0276 family)